LKVGLVDVDSKIHNLALMKLSAFHKNKKDSVEFYNPENMYDIIYSSKIFDFSEDKTRYPEDTKVIKGGSGSSFDEKLPKECINQYPDYGLYDLNYAVGFTSRGCIRNCGFCIVPELEGYIRPVSDIHTFWNGQEKMQLLDNNLLALDDHFFEILNQIRRNRIKIDFSQGLDIRLITPEKARFLSRVMIWKKLRFSFDLIGMEDAVREGIKILTDHGIRKYKMMFYILIGYNTNKEEDLYRINLLRDLNIDPFVMPYNKNDEYQKNFARWVNHKAIFKTVEWEDYQK